MNRLLADDLLNRVNLFIHLIRVPLLCKNLPCHSKLTRMDQEHEQGMDPEMKRFFQKILSTITYGLLWMMAAATAGLYYKLAWRDERPLYAVILFYTLAVAGLFVLLRYYYTLWKK